MNYSIPIGPACPAAELGNCDQSSNWIGQVCCGRFSSRFLSVTGPSRSAWRGASLSAIASWTCYGRFVTFPCPQKAGKTESRRLSEKVVFTHPNAKSSRWLVVTYDFNIYMIKQYLSTGVLLTETTTNLYLFMWKKYVWITFPWAFVVVSLM